MRHEWYQTEAFVVVTILVRNAKQEDVSVNFSEASLSVNVKLPESEPYHLGLRLAHKAVPQKCSFRVMQTKIEVKVAKMDGIQWTTLEGDPESQYPKQASIGSSSSAGPPRYPTSNPSHRDWNAIEQELVKEMAQEKAEGEDGVNQLFQKIYGEGTDEVKRAMNKSYVESGGTVLSTNWKEIAKDKVPIKPPDGMEWKKWDK